MLMDRTTQRTGERRGEEKEVVVVVVVMVSVVEVGGVRSCVRVCAVEEGEGVVACGNSQREDGQTAEQPDWGKRRGRSRAWLASGHATTDKGAEMDGRWLAVGCT